MGALIIGAAAGLICYRATSLIKQTLKIDDSLDVFAVHGVGGCLGVLLTAVLAAPAFGGLGLAEGFTVGEHLWVQFVGVAATVAWAGVLTYVIVKVVGALVGLRVSEDQENEGLDITAHGERGYSL